MLSRALLFHTLRFIHSVYDSQSTYKVGIQGAYRHIPLLGWIYLEIQFRPTKAGRGNHNGLLNQTTSRDYERAPRGSRELVAWPAARGIPRGRSDPNTVMGLNGAPGRGEDNLVSPTKTNYSPRYIGAVQDLSQSSNTSSNLRNPCQRSYLTMEIPRHRDATDSGLFFTYYPCIRNNAGRGTEKLRACINHSRLRDVKIWGVLPGTCCARVYTFWCATDSSRHFSKSLIRFACEFMLPMKVFRRYIRLGIWKKK